MKMDKNVIPLVSVVKSRSEVKRNKPELCKELNESDCFWVK